MSRFFIRIQILIIPKLSKMAEIKNNEKANANGKPSVDEEMNEQEMTVDENDSDESSSDDEDDNVAQTEEIFELKKQVRVA